MSTLINVENIIMKVKKWALCSVLICSSFGLFYQIGSIYQYKQIKEENNDFINVNNVFWAMKKGLLISFANAIFIVVSYVNIKYLSILDYSQVMKFILLVINYIFIFELVLINIYFPMYSIESTSLFNILKKCLLISNLNFGLSIIILFITSVFLGCIIASPYTSFLLVPLFLSLIFKLYNRLEIKYQKMAGVVSTNIV